MERKSKKKVEKHEEGGNVGVYSSNIGGRGGLAPWQTRVTGDEPNLKKGGGVAGRQKKSWGGDILGGFRKIGNGIGAGAQQIGGGIAGGAQQLVGAARKVSPFKKGGGVQYDSTSKLPVAKNNSGGCIMKSKKY